MPGIGCQVGDLLLVTMLGLRSSGLGQTEFSCRWHGCPWRHLDEDPGRLESLRFGTIPHSHLANCSIKSPITVTECRCEGLKDLGTTSTEHPNRELVDGATGVLDTATADGDLPGRYVNGEEAHRRLRTLGNTQCTVSVDVGTWTTLLLSVTLISSAFVVRPIAGPHIVRSLLLCGMQSPLVQMVLLPVPRLISWHHPRKDQ